MVNSVCMSSALAPGIPPWSLNAATIIMECYVLNKRLIQCACVGECQVNNAVCYFVLFFSVEISQETAVNPVDIVSTLQSLQMLKYWKGKHLVLKRQVRTAPEGRRQSGMIKMLQDVLFFCCKNRALSQIANVDANIYFLMYCRGTGSREICRMCLKPSILHGNKCTAKNDIFYYIGIGM